MKKVLLAFNLLLASLLVKAGQPTVPVPPTPGVLGVQVERYYIMNAADSIWAATSASSNVTNAPVAPRVGTTTYRIYVKLAPGYSLLNVFGEVGNPLVLGTSTHFFNTDDGNYNPNYSSALLYKKGLGAVDSWVTFGAATSDGHYGILKADQTGTVALTSNQTGLLRHNNPAAGAALTQDDGINSTTGATAAPGLIGITTNQMGIFKDGTYYDSTQTLTTTSGSYYVLGGVVGLASDSNKILIGQFTTDGQFTYKLNLVVKNYNTSASANYVSTNATGSEILMPALAGTIGGPVGTTTVAVTSPAPKSIFATGDTVTFTSNASETPGGIVSVQYYVNGVAVGTALKTAPYTFKWKGVSGKDTVTAVATDVNGTQTASAGVPFVVATTYAPKVAVTAPVQSATLIVGDYITLSAIASDTVQTVASVQFYVNGNAVGSPVTTAPYSVSWTAQLGTDTITAIATSSLNVKTTSAKVIVNVIPDTPPTVIVTDPQNNASILNGTQITVSATANTNVQGGSISKVEFFANHQSIGTVTKAPYSLSWIVATGKDTITAIATDNRNVNGYSDTVVVTGTLPVAPLVTVVAPLSSETIINGDNITLTATASDPNQGGSITNVNFYVNGQLIGNTSTSPYSVTWASTSGTDTIVAQATNNFNIVGTSAMVIVQVKNNVPPTSVITAPGNNITYVLGDNVNISSTAASSDTLGSIVNVVYVVNGQPVGSSSKAPFHFTWKSNQLGTDTITAVAIDNRGSQTTSTYIIVNVVNEVPPTVAITAPANNSVLQVNNQIAITVATADADTNGVVTTVAYFANGVLIGTATQAPFNFNWTPVNIGTDTLTAIATDNRSGKTTSSKVVVTVDNSNGIAAIGANKENTIYPNPTNGQLNILFGRNTQSTVYTVYNLTGVAMLNKNLESVIAGQLEVIDLSHLPAGVYFLELIQDGARKTNRIVKN